MSNILVSSIRDILHRDLDKLKSEINSYTNNQDLWKIWGEIRNPAGNLCLHLCGNLQHYIGAVIGKSGYQRNRDAEFARKNLSKEELLEEIEMTIQIVDKTLNKADQDLAEWQYPEDVFGRPVTTGFFLIHLAGHFNYHLGQVNYHRRLIKT